MKKTFKSRLTSVVVASGLALTLGAGTAFAEDALDTTGYVTAAATRAAQPASDILGVSGVEETANDWYDMNNLFNWSGPKYLLMGTTLYNSNPNPYFYNYMYKTSGNSVVINTSREGGGRGPAGGLAAYGVDATDDAVWNALPDIVVGTGIKGGATADYTSDEYAGAIEEALGVEYNPVGIDYNMTNNSEFIDTMYSIAEAADDIVANSDGVKKLRYGNATDIAVNYEKYIRGTQGYVLHQLSANDAQKKVVASVSGYDTTTNTFRLLVSGEAEGTSSTNRYLEAVEQVSTNLVDALGIKGTDVTSTGRDGQETTTTVYSCTAEELAKADLVVIGGQQGQGSEVLTKIADILNKMSSEQQAKCYYVTDANNSAGSMYGVTMNSVENAQNIGRIIGCLYPEYIDQDDWMSYYYDVFYHVKSADLADAIDKAMDGVRNWDSTGDATTWTTEDASTYNKDDVQGKLDIGVSYLKAAENDKTPDALKVTDHIQESASVVSLFGENAYQTAVAISQETFKSSTSVVIANDRDYMDSMSATGLAGVLDCPILLVNADTGLYDEVKAELERLGVEKVYIIGGEHAVTKDLESQLGTDIETQRVFGNEAPDTSVACANEIQKLGGSLGYAIVARSDNFQDALSMSSFAYAHKAAIILAPSTEGSAATSLPEGGAAVLQAATENVFIAGGEGAIDDSTVAGVVNDAVRIWGEDGYDTSNQIATYMVANNLLKPASVTVANGSQAARGLDALAGAALAGKTNGVILLANGSEHTDTMGAQDFTTINEGPDSQDTQSFLKANADSVSLVYTLGGSYVMPQSAIDTIAETLE